MKLCPVCLRCYEDAATACERPGHDVLVPSRHGSRVIADKYRLDKLIGRGGMGAVYAGVHVELERPAAIKLLLPDFAADSLVGERFRREARAAARLNHPNVAATFDYGTLAGGESYIVMELVEGQTLNVRLREAGQLAFREAVSVARQVAHGIEHAHRGGIVHRDLKPSNVILSRDHRGALLVKVLDFGIAKLKEYATGAHDPITKTGSLVGTPRYMSPEQCSDHEVDARSDVYSLGVILYEMLAGHAPFEAPSAAALALKHIQEQPPPLRSSRADTPAALERIVEWTMAKDPAARPQTAAELARALEEVEALLPREAARVGAGADAPLAGAHETGPHPAVSTDAERYVAPDTNHSGASTGSRPSIITSAEERPLAPEDVRPRPRDDAKGHSLEDFRLGEDDGGGRPAQEEFVHEGLAPASPVEVVLPAPAPVVAGGHETLTRPAVRPAPTRRKGLRLAGVVGLLSLLLAGVVAVVLLTRRSDSSSSSSATTAVVTETSAPTPSTSPPPRETPPASNASTPAAGGDARALRAALDRWIAATNARDLGGQLELYAPRLEAFYTRRGVTREEVRAEKRGTFADASMVLITVAEPSIEVAADGRTSVMRFRKQYVIEAPGRARSGEVLQELRWSNTPEGWRITSERDLQVIR